MGACAGEGLAGGAPESGKIQAHQYWRKPIGGYQELGQCQMPEMQRSGQKRNGHDAELGRKFLVFPALYRPEK